MSKDNLEVHEGRALPPYRPISFELLQAAALQWRMANFPVSGGSHNIMGMTEEVGELVSADEETDDPHILELVKALGRCAHAQLKGEQGIRHSSNEILKQKEDAVADIIIFLVNYCSSNGINIGRAVAETWDKVSARDWVKNPIPHAPGINADEYRVRCDYYRKHFCNLCGAFVPHDDRVIEPNTHPGVIFHQSCLETLIKQSADLKTHSYPQGSLSSLTRTENKQ